MDLVIIRHARAAEPVIDDARRTLTPRGRRDALRLGERLRRAGVRFDALVVSPLLRAVETAELVAVGLDFEGQLEVALELRPQSLPRDVLDEVVAPRAELETVALVGHQPLLGELLGHLLQRAVPEPARPSAVCLRWHGGDEPAELRWVLRPDLDEPSRSLLDLF